MIDHAREEPPGGGGEDAPGGGRYEYHCAEPGCPHKGEPRTARCIKDRHACLTVRADAP